MGFCKGGLELLIQIFIICLFIILDAFHGQAFGAKSDVNEKILKRLEAVSTRNPRAYIFRPEALGQRPFPYENRIRSRKGFPPIYIKLLRKLKKNRKKAFEPVSDFSKFPSISKHSAASTEVTSGNRVQLEIRASLGEVGNVTKFIWRRNDVIVCRSSKCIVNTKGWSAGNHLIRAAVFNNHGMVYLDFYIKVKFRIEDRKLELVVAEMIDPVDGTVKLSSTGAFVRARAGGGYLYRKKGATPVDEFAIPLDWNEGLSSGGESLVRYGEKGKHEHYLFSETQVDLLQLGKGRLGIELKSGIFRSRNLSKEVPSWILFPGEGMQLDGDLHSDVVVQVRSYGGDRVVKFLCLRGRCRFTVKNDAVRFKWRNRSFIHRSMMEGQYVKKISDYMIYYLGAGEALEVRTKSRKIPMTKASKGEALTRLVDLTTPEYLDIGNLQTFMKNYQSGQSGDGKGGYFLSSFSPVTQGRPASPSKLLLRIENMMTTFDYFGALETLAQLPNSYHQTAEYNLLLGFLLLRVHFYDVANQFLGRAAEKESLQPWANLLKAELFLLLKEWSTALKMLEDMNEIPPEKEQLVTYYLGVCETALENPTDSMLAFEESLWHGKDTVIRESTMDFLRVARADKVFHYDLNASLFQNSNVLSRGGGDPVTAPYEISGDSSLVYGLNADLSGRLVSEEGADLRIGMKLRYFGVKESALSVAKDQAFEFYMKSVADMGPPKDPFAKFTFYPFIKRITRGAGAVDGFGLDIRVALVSFFLKPEFGMRNSQYLDPDPFGINILDPFTNEPAGELDRSSRFFIYDLQLTPWENGRDAINIDVSYTSHVYRRDTSRGDDYESMEVLSKLFYGVADQMRLLARLGYETRDFKNSTDKRQDKTLKVGLKLPWEYRPLASVGFVIQMKNNDSNRESSEYNQNLIGIDWTVKN